MELKQNIILETLKNDFAFAFHMPTGATWGNALDAAFEILQKLHELAQESVKAANPVPQSTVDQPAVEPEVVVKGE